jgi:FdhD protein
MSASAVPKHVWPWEHGHRQPRRADVVAAEEPLEIRLDTRSLTVTMRTPGDDQALAAGFLLSEGVIHSRQDIVRMQAYARNPQGNVLDVFLAPHVRVDLSSLSRHVFTSSSCGLCGRTTLQAVRRQFPAVTSDVRVAASVLSQLPEQLRHAQTLFAATGGLHAAGLFDSAGTLLSLREDIGRHNAVDKVVGHGLLHNRLPWDRHILLVSGRVSFEIMLKALAARIPIVGAVSAPSSLAVEFARQSGQTLAGFVRGQRFNIYAGPKRVTTTEHSAIRTRTPARRRAPIARRKLESTPS